MKLRSILSLASLGVFTLTLAPSQAALVGYYTLDGNFLDSSGNNNHGTLIGGAAYDGSVPGAIGAGQSVSFDGAAGTYGNIQNAAQTGGLAITTAPSFTVAMWVNSAITGTDDRIFSEGSSSNNNPLFNIGNTNNGSAPNAGSVDVYIRAANGTAFGHAYSAGTAFDGTWRHVLFAGGTDGLLDLYIDGVFDGTFDYSAIPAFTPDTTTIGGILRATDCCNFNGLIDDVSLWDQDLSQGDITALASGASALSIPEPSSLVLALAGLMLAMRRRR